MIITECTKAHQSRLKFKIVRFIFINIIGFIAGITAVNAQTKIIRLKVMDEISKTPLSGAVVSLHIDSLKHSLNRVLYEVVSDKNGLISMNLPDSPKKFIIEVNLNGYSEEKIYYQPGSGDSNLYFSVKLSPVAKP